MKSAANCFRVLRKVQNVFCDFPKVSSKPSINTPRVSTTRQSIARTENPKRRSEGGLFTSEAMRKSTGAMYRSWIRAASMSTALAQSGLFGSSSFSPCHTAASTPGAICIISRVDRYRERSSRLHCDSNAAAGSDELKSSRAKPRSRAVNSKQLRVGICVSGNL